MSAASEEWEEVVAPDGNTYKVSRKPYEPLPRLPVGDAERSSINEAISKMASLARRRGIICNEPRRLNENKDVCSRIDSLIADTLVELRSKVRSDPAEKLFEILMDSADRWEDPEESWSLGLIAIRFLDTMEYFVSFKKKFRGADRSRVRYTKEEAFAVLKERGLTKK